MRTKLLLTLLALLAGTVSASAYDFYSGSLCYDFNDDGTTVCVVNQFLSSPSYNAGDLPADLVIPETVTYAGKTYSVTSIGRSAFADCSGLTSVTIPHSLTSLGDVAFSGCTGLTSVVWNAKTCADVNNDNDVNPFNGMSNIKTFTFGDEVERIPAYLCKKLSGLTSVTIPNSVTSIGRSAFDGCTGLTSVTIPNSVLYIDSFAFYETPWLNNQPNGLIYVGLLAYEYKGTMPSGTNIVIKDGTRGIASSAFCYCSGLTSVTIPNSVTAIGNEAFASCTGLTSVTIPNSVTAIGNEAFASCSGLTSVNIPNSVTAIGNGAFASCTGLTSVTIPASVASIGESVFKDCSSLSSVYYNATNCAFDGAYVFSNAPLKKIVIGEWVEIIPKFFAVDQKKISSIIIPNSVTTINKNAFEGCI